MSDFTVFCSWDGTTKTADDGGVLTFNVGPGALIVVRQNLDNPNGETNTVGVNGILGQNVPQPIVGSMLGQQNCVVFCGVQQQEVSGVYHAGISIANNGIQSLGFILNYQAPATATTGGIGTLGEPPIAALPEDVIDVSCNLRTRSARSAIMALMTGIKIGDSIKLAVIPVRDSTGFIATGIDEIKLALQPAMDFSGDPIVFTFTSPSVSGSSPNRYYLLSFTFDGEKIDEWFAAANDATEAGQTTQDASKLLVAMELRFKEGSAITTTESFNVYALQSIATPNQ